MDWKILAKTVAGLLVILGTFLLVPGAYAVSEQSQLRGMFLSIAFAVIALGLLVWCLLRSYRSELNVRTSFAVVTFSWISACIIGALPYYISGTLESPYDALFEATSGFTTTGASVIPAVEGVDQSLLLWRSLTQWIGGMGIIVFSLVLLPLLGVGGMQLFRAEAPGPQKDKITPRVSETARKLWALYVGFTVSLFLILLILGMDGFHAINHALCAVSTGGFSTRNSGISAFNSVYIDYAIAAFMLIGGINFGLHYRFIVQRDWQACRDTELKWFIGIVALTTAILTIANYGPVYSSWSESLRYSFFQIVAISTSTGFTNPDYIAWPAITQFVIVLVMVMGGMAGSTGGGMKCIRLVTAFKHLHRELKRIVHPKAIYAIKANDRSIPANIIDSIWGFIFIYFLTFSICAFILMIYGLDLVSATSASFSALSNTGPALGKLGPYSNYASLADGAKLTLMFCMILGRLELFTVLVLLTPTFWRK